MRLASILGAGVLACTTAAVADSTPEVGVLIFTPWGAGGDISAEILARIAPADGSGALRLATPTVVAADLATCSRNGVQPEPCIREILAGRDGGSAEGPPTVIVLVRPSPFFGVGWTCIGQGDDPSDAARQSVYIDSRPDQAATAEAAATACIMAAAAEARGS